MRAARLRLQSRIDEQSIIVSIETQRLEQLQNMMRRILDHMAAAMKETEGKATDLA